LIHFGQLFIRKLSKLIELNLLFLIPTIVVFALSVGITLLGVPQPILCFIPVILLSPFIAGLTMITRNFAREDHAFVLSDFIDAVKKNWKPFLINGVICYIFGSVIYVALRYYLLMSGKGWMYVIALSISILVALLFLFSQYYIPVMIITFDLKLKQIYRNAIIFAFLGLWRNLMLTVIFVVLIFANYVAFFIQMPLLVMIAIVLILLIAFSFVSFLTNFTVYPLIEKMIIKPYYEKQNAPVVADTTQNEPAILEGTQGDKESSAVADTAPEYVFVDGKLVKKYPHDDSVFKDKI